MRNSQRIKLGYSDILVTDPAGLGQLLPERPLPGLSMFGAVTGYGAATLLFVFSTVFWLSLAALFGTFVAAANSLMNCDWVNFAILSPCESLILPVVRRLRASARSGTFE